VRLIGHRFQKRHLGDERPIHHGAIFHPKRSDATVPTSTVISKRLLGEPKACAFRRGGELVRGATSVSCGRLGQTCRRRRSPGNPAVPKG
jgi:hypothetical protein